ncbi:MAG: WG repeat-containing protein [Mangrovibacterium sp.]
MRKIISYIFMVMLLLPISCKKDKDEVHEEDPSNYYADETGLQTDLYPINDTGGKLSYINAQGDIILRTDCAFLSTSYFYNDRARVSINVKLSEGKVDRKTIVGTISIDGLYDNEPYYGIYYADTEQLRRLYYNYDDQPLTGYEYGDAIMEPYYEMQSWYGYKYGAIDKNGQFIIEPQYVDMGRYSKCLLTFTGDTWSEYRYHDFAGNIIRVDGKEKHYKSASNFKSGHAITQNANDSIFIIINENFEVTDSILGYYNSPLNVKSWSVVSEFCDMMCRIEHYKMNSELGYYQAKYGFSNTYGRIIIPVQLDYAMDFYNSYSLYELNGLWGYLNTGGRAAIAAQYADAHPFVEDVSSVKDMDDEWMLIDKNNNILSEARFKSTGITSSELTAFIPLDSESNLYGFMNNKGEVVIEPQFYSSSYYEEKVIEATFWDNLALVEIDELQSAYITKTGEIVWQGETGNDDPLISYITPKGMQIAPHQYKEKINKRMKML